MITGLQVVSIIVNDQEAALRFYTETLGFEKVHDDLFDGGRRWISVRIPGTTGPLLTLEPASEDFPAGGWQGGGYVFETDDIAATHKLYRERGVTFTEPPTPQMWGIQALFTDPDGNIFVLLQPPEAPGA